MRRSTGETVTTARNARASSAEPALAQVALARGALPEAVTSARSALQWFFTALSEDLHLDTTLLVARAIQAAGTDEERAMVGGFLQFTLAMIAQRTLDEDVRVRWFRGPLAAELSKLAAPMEAVSTDARSDRGRSGLEEPERDLLRLLIEGRTNREIALELGVEEETVTRRLAEMFVKIGASSRAEATAFAFRERVL